MVWFPAKFTKDDRRATRYKARVRHLMTLFTLVIATLSLVPGSLLAAQSGGSQAMTESNAAAAWPSERGTIFGPPHDGDWSKLGAYVGIYSYTDKYDRMSPNAIKVGHGEYQFVNREGDMGLWPYLSLNRLTQIDRQERAASRPGVLMTGTWNGRSYPLYWWWSSGFVCDGCAATKPAQYWKQMINVASPAYMDYYVNEYIKGKMWNPQYQNYWIGVDEGAWYQGHYGIIDDNGVWHTGGVTYDAPAPRTQADYVAMNIAFLKGVHSRMPELKLMVNDGGAPTVEDLQAVDDHFDGVMNENFYGYFSQVTPCEGCADYGTRELYTLIRNYWRMGDAGKAGILTFMVDGSDQQSINAYALYLIARGPNFFFGLQTGEQEIYNAAQDTMRTALGLPVSAPTSQQIGAYPENRLYSRVTQNGNVYVNFTGATQTVQLPAGATYTDRFGNRVTSLTLANRSAGYVLRQGAAPVTPTPTPPTATTCPAGQWKAEYFANKTLTGTPALTRCDAAINNDWKTGIPAPGLPADNFSVRWSGPFAFAAGSYTFSLTGDDGIRLLLDGAKILDGWKDQAPVTYTATKAVTAGTHQVVVEYYEAGDGAVAKASWQAVAPPPSSPTATPSSTPKPPVGTGCAAGQWKAEYFNNRTLAGTPSLTRCESALNNTWAADVSPAPGISSNNFSVRWSGSFSFSAKSYTFSLTGDDGIRMLLDGTKIIDGWKDQAPTTYTTARSVTAGNHQVTVEYYQADDRGAAIASWR